jgi:hypothetical protein
MTYICIEAMERSPMDCGDDTAQGFPLPADCCIPFQPPVTHIDQHTECLLHGYHYKHLCEQNG